MGRHSVLRLSRLLLGNVQVCIRLRWRSGSRRVDASIQRHWESTSGIFGIHSSFFSIPDINRDMDPSLIASLDMLQKSAKILLSLSWMRAKCCKWHDRPSTKSKRGQRAFTSAYLGDENNSRCVPFEIQIYSKLFSICMILTIWLTKSTHLNAWTLLSLTFVRPFNLSKCYSFIVRSLNCLHFPSDSRRQLVPWTCTNESTLDMTPLEFAERCPSPEILRLWGSTFGPIHLGPLWRQIARYAEIQNLRFIFLCCSTTLHLLSLIDSSKFYASVFCRECRGGRGEGERERTMRSAFVRRWSCGCPPFREWWGTNCCSLLSVVNEGCYVL